MLISSFLMEAVVGRKKPNGSIYVKLENTKYSNSSKYSESNSRDLF